MLGTIYNAHFGFRESPFGLTPDPGFFYVNECYRETLSLLTYGLETRKGLIVVTGETGTGKTTLIRKLMCGLAPNVRTAYLFNTLVSFADLIRLILTDLGLESSAEDKLQMIGRLEQYLLEQHRDGYIVALLIDEAQDLRPEVLEELRLLMDLESDTEKLLQIALIGQPELEQKLNEPELLELNQRVALRSQLGPLPAGEVQSYIESRLQAVSERKEILFNREAIEKIFLYSKGIPRLINSICDSALLNAYAAAQSKIDGEIIDEVAADLLLEQVTGERGFAVPPTKRQPPETSFSGSVSEENPRHATTENLVDTAYNAALIPDAAPLAEFHVDRSRRWPRIGSVFFVLFLGLSGFFFSRQSGISTHKPSEREVPDRRIDEEDINLSVTVSQEEAEPLPLQQQIPTSQAQMPSSSEQNLSLQEIEKPIIPKGDEINSEKRRPRTVKQESDSTEKFYVVGASFVRNKPTSDADIVATLEPGSRVIADRKGDYYWVRSIGIKPVRGYVHQQDAFFERSK